MKVECHRLDDFLVNVSRELEGKGSVYSGVVYLNVIQTPLEGTKRDAVRFLVVFRVSTIIDLADGQYLLVAEEECGIDYHDASDEKGGTKQAKILEKQLNYFCKNSGLSIRPGTVDF
jgi:hypothetical protein